MAGQKQGPTIPLAHLRCSGQALDHCGPLCDAELSRYDAAAWACGGHEATGVYRGDGIRLTSRAESQRLLKSSVQLL
jgi:hypothetical protein